MITGYDDPERQFEEPPSCCGGSGCYLCVEPETPPRSAALAGTGENPSTQPRIPLNSVQGDSEPKPPRDLAAVIDAMLAEIPETEYELRYGLERYHACRALLSERLLTLDIAVDLAAYLVKYSSSDLWYEKVMAIWSGKASESTKVAAAVLETDSEVAQAVLDSPDHAQSLGDTPNIAGEAWSDSEATSTEVVCADCGAPPQLALLAQDAMKCVRCFILAGMNKLCFQCGKNPTEAIVRAVAPDGTDDTVGTCINCLMAHVSAGRN